VFSALVIGLALFRYQHRETDRKKREELAALLQTELEELRWSLLASRTSVPEEVWDDLIPSASREIRLSIHHPHPLVVEEAARSGLFGAESTTAMLVLARDIRAHSFYLREATRLEPHMERAWAKGIRYQAEHRSIRSSSGCSGSTRRPPGWSSSRKRASSWAASECPKGFPRKSRDQERSLGVR
jgi:hypothetical protein